MSRINRTRLQKLDLFGSIIIMYQQWGTHFALRKLSEISVKMFVISIKLLSVQKVRELGFFLNRLLTRMCIWCLKDRPSQFLCLNTNKLLKAIYTKFLSLTNIANTMIFKGQGKTFSDVVNCNVSVQTSQFCVNVVIGSSQSLPTYSKPFLF
jgi:hypothetical protein